MQTRIIRASRLIRHNYRSRSHTFRHIRHYYRPKYQAIRSNQTNVGNNDFIIWGHNGILRTVIHRSFSNYSLLLTLQKAVAKAWMKKLFTDRLFFEFVHLTMTLVNYQSTTTGKRTSDSMSDETIICARSSFSVVPTSIGTVAQRWCAVQYFCASSMI